MNENNYKSYQEHIIINTDHHNESLSNDLSRLTEHGINSDKRREKEEDEVEEFKEIISGKFIKVMNYLICISLAFNIFLFFYYGIYTWDDLSITSLDHKKINIPRVFEFLLFLLIVNQAYCLFYFRKYIFITDVTKPRVYSIKTDFGHEKANYVSTEKNQLSHSHTKVYEKRDKSAKNIVEYMLRNLLLQLIFVFWALFYTIRFINYYSEDNNNAYIITLLIIFSALLLSNTIIAATGIIIFLIKLDFKKLCLILF